MSEVINKEKILEAAKELLSHFLEADESNAGHLSLELKPTMNDYFKIFNQEAALKCYNAYESYFWDDSAVYSIKKKYPEYNAIHLVLSTSFELKDDPKQQALFPGGYEQVVAHYSHDVPIIRFKFVEEGSTTGMAYDGLYCLNDSGTYRFVFIPKPWRVINS